MHDFTKKVLTERVNYLRTAIRVEEESIQHHEGKFNKAKVAERLLEEELNTIESDISK